MSTHVQLLYHVVFATKNRRPVLLPERRREFLAYSHGTIEGLGCHTYRINAVEDHLHMFLSIHQDVKVADFVKKFKVATSKWIKSNGVFPGFNRWQEGYGAFTLSWKDREGLISYIRNQEEHHRREPFLTEFQRIVEEEGLVWDGKYLP